MSGEKLYAVPGSLASSAHINNKKYLTMYARSIEDPDNFWAEQAEVFVTWYKKWNKVLEWDFTDANIGISLPGTGEAPSAPVFIDGKMVTILRGDNIAGEFRQIVDDYVKRTYAHA